MHSSIKKFLFGGIILGIILPKLAFAQVDWAIGGLAAFLNTITAFFMKIAAFFSEVALVLSLNIVNSSAVQQGFKIALTLANLGFVISIIVIALATIFRNQTYGVKRALIRLVVMAILVNFSLILTGMVLNFTDRLTLYFVSASAPEQGFGGSFNFSYRIMSSLNPQAVQNSPPEEGLLNSLDKTFAASAGALLASVSNILTLLAFSVLAVTLFARYTIISILLISMPIAWLAWIFPSTSSWWKKWWDTFIKWTFYAPAMMFFVYIAMTLAQSDALVATLNTAQETDVASVLGNTLVKSNTLAAISKQITILFILFGGFFAAKSMGIGMAGSASSLAQSAGKKMWGATKRGAGRNARRAGGAMFGETLKKYGEKWQRAGANSNSFMRTLAAPVRGIGRQMTGAKEGLTSGTFKQYQEKITNWSEDQRVNAIAASRGVEQIALLESLKDSKRFSEAVRRIPAGAMEGETIFDRWGKKDLHKLSRNVSGLALKEISDNRAALGDKPMDEAVAVKYDEDLAGVGKALDGDKWSGMFGTYKDDKKIFNMPKEDYERWQADAARALLLGGSVGKIQKLLENDNPEIRENFVKSMLASGLKWDDVNKKNKSVSTWMQGKGRQYLGDEEIEKLKIPEQKDKSKKKDEATANA